MSPVVCFFWVIPHSSHFFSADRAETIMATEATIAPVVLCVADDNTEHRLPRNDKLVEIPEAQLFIGMVPLGAMKEFLRIKKELVVKRNDTLHLTLDQLLKKQVGGNKFQRIGSSNTDQNQGGMFQIPLGKTWKNKLVKDRAVKALLESISRSLPLQFADYNLDARFLVRYRYQILTDTIVPPRDPDGPHQLHPTRPH
jgi:hypothetical protein